MRRSGPSTLGLAAVLALGLVDACRRPISESSRAADRGNAGDLPAEDAGRGSALRPARCRPTETGIVIDDGRAADVEIGDAVATADGYAVGLVHRTSAGRVAAVVAVPRSSTAVDAGSPRSPTRVTDLGPTIGDAPAPRLALRGTSLVAAAYARPRAGESNGAAGHGARRDLVLYAVTPEAQAEPFLTVAQQRDDSLAFDMAFAGPSGVVVWDEATAASRGVVRAVDVRPDAGAHGAPHDVSPPESDAELPRVVANGGGGPGFLVLWIARRPESPRGPDASEATGEPRSFGWLELVRVDERGAPLGAVKLLTTRSGHVSAYDVEVLASPARTLLVVARDDGEATDGSGGALLRVRVTGDTVEPPVEFSTDGLGRGAPTFVDGSSSYLSWVGPQEQARLLPLDGSGAPTSAPSAEDAFDEARPLRVLEGPLNGTGPAKLLVATPSGQPFKLRDFMCARDR